ncbi:MAG TPA: hypothetical protein VGI87_12105 [Solirubrobacteraceae bacterium]
MSAAELSLGSRALLQGSVGFDLALRTALATTVAVPATLWVARADTERERERLDFYRAAAATRDPADVFIAPAFQQQVEVLDAPWFAPGAPAGCVRTLRFESPYAAFNPDLRDDYGRYAENRVAWAQHWSHGDRPRTSARRSSTPSTTSVSS